MNKINKEYTELTDEEKIIKNWAKARGLFKRKEWSVAILRCATCLELAINFSIRQELEIKHKLPQNFVDQMLISANGIHNKYQKLYLPIMKNSGEEKKLTDLWKMKIEPVNKERNSIAHQGQFKSKKIAIDTMQKTFDALKQLLRFYNVKHKLKSFSPE